MDTKIFKNDNNEIKTLVTYVFYEHLTKQKLYIKFLI